MGSGTEVFSDFSVPAGRLVAEMGYNILTGAGRGTMLKASEAFSSVSGRKGLCIGIVPSTMNSSGQYIPNLGYPNEFVEIPIYTPLPSLDYEHPEKLNRNYVNVLTSDVVVVLPGNIGTRNEIELALRFNKPMILFCPQGYYDDIDGSVSRTDKIEDIRKFIESKLS